MSGFAYSPERSDKILEMLARKGKLSVTEIVESFSVSEATARRDLNFLAREGKIRRYYGGAILCQEAAPEGPILQRTMEQQEEKERICPSARLTKSALRSVGKALWPPVRCLAQPRALCPTSPLTISLAIAETARIDGGCPKRGVKEPK